MFNMNTLDLSNFLLGFVAALFIVSLATLSAVDITLTGSLLAFALYQRTLEPKGK